MYVIRPEAIFGCEVWIIKKVDIQTLKYMKEYGTKKQTIKYEVYFSSRIKHNRSGESPALEIDGPYNKDRADAVDTQYNGKKTFRQA